MVDAPRRVAVLGGSRIPFARAHGTYATATAREMLTAALDGLVTHHALDGQRLGEVVGGAVLKHTRDRDLTRESLLETKLSPETPACDVAQACATGLQATILIANKIALGQIDAGITCGTDSVSDAPIALNERMRLTLLEANRQPSRPGKLRALTKLRPRHLIPAIPRNEEPRTGLSMGEHCALMAEEWGIGRAEQDELTVQSHHNLLASYERGFHDDLVLEYRGLRRDQNLRAEITAERLAQLSAAFGGPEGTLTAANSTPLSDGASAVLLSSEEWARERDLPVLAYLTHAETVAVNHAVGQEGLLMAPVHGMARMLDRAGLTLQDFEHYEIHEAFAAQVLCTLAAWEDPEFCRAKLRRDTPLGEIDRAKLNVNGGSLAAGHPFAATGGRIVAALAKQLAENGGGRGVVSICAAGGQGALAILEGPGES